MAPGKPALPSPGIHPGTAEETIYEEERCGWLQIVSARRRQGDRWFVTDGIGAFPAVIEDADFLARIDRREVAFAKADVLRCLVRERQSRTGQGALKKDLAILRVLEHRSRAQRLKLI